MEHVVRFLPIAALLTAGIGSAATPPAQDAIGPTSSARALVAQLDPIRFRQNVATLASYGTRYWSEEGNHTAGNWLQAELASYGYVVERHTYPVQGQQRSSLYVTKQGAARPDQMWIVSAHIDSLNVAGILAPGADDDASGVSLVLEAARVFAPQEVQTESSVRFVFWNNEETGLEGSSAYVADRRALQGVETPPGSGRYPEPLWLGIIQHDMILFDHGVPPQPSQIPGADIDVEYQASAAYGGLAIQLADALRRGNAAHAVRYPVEVGSDMQYTDSNAFQDDCPAVSVRENRRMTEIGNGANPHWHRETDVVASYSDDDFLFGFDTVRTTVGAIADLAHASVRLAVRFTDPASKDLFSWTVPGAPVSSASYDVARGDLARLLQTGTFSSAVCIANDRSAPEIVDDSIPDLAQGFWYLVRFDGEGWNASLEACP